MGDGTPPLPTLLCLSNEQEVDGGDDFLVGGGSANWFPVSLPAGSLSLLSLCISVFGTSAFISRLVVCFACPRRR